MLSPLLPNRASSPLPAGFLLSENIAEPDDEHRPLRVASSLKLSAIPAAEPAASASHTPRGPSGAEGVGATAMLGFDFAKAGGRMVDALDSALPPRRAPKGEDAMPLKVEGRAGWGGMAVEITKVPEVPARADKDKGSELVMPAFGGGHSSAQNMPKVEGLQLVSPQSGTREGGRTKISDDSSQMAFVPPPVPSKSMRPQERGYQDDEDDTQMCPFCRKVQSGDASDDKCKDCGLSLQVCTPRRHALGKVETWHLHSVDLRHPQQRFCGVALPTSDPGPEREFDQAAQHDLTLGVLTLSGGRHGLHADSTRRGGRRGRRVKATHLGVARCSSG